MSTDRKMRAATKGSEKSPFKSLKIGHRKRSPELATKLQDMDYRRLLKQLSVKPEPAFIATPAGIVLMASTPVFIGVKTNGIPMAFQPMHEGDFARYAVELAGLMVAGRR
jgi:hypothetical protein